MLGIVTGLQSEAKLLEGLGLACVSTGGQAREARRKIDRLIAEGATGLVSFGIAGALSPDLRAGDLIVADLVTNDIGESWQTHQPWLEVLRRTIGQSAHGHRANAVPHHAAARRSEGHAAAAPLWSPDGDTPDPEAPADRVSSITTAVRPGPGPEGTDVGVRIATMLGLDRLLSSPEEKAEAFARRGAIAIDMESHHVARAAGERNLPFIAVRAISDRADEALPAIMATFVDGDGQTKMSAVLAALIFHRVGLASLLRAGGASRRAHQSLLRCRGAVAGLR